jgi:CDP-4-dehydro-6-deoxyglucose reductase
MTARRVTLQPSGRSFGCAADRSVLDSAIAAGIALPYGCRTGTCGECRARLVHGTVDPGPREPLGLTDVGRATGHVLLCQARPTSDLTVEVAELASGRPRPVKTLPARVARLERLAHDVMGVWLRIPPVERLGFVPGQYLDVLLPDGARRSFSLANPPHDDATLELHVRRVAGGRFSTEVFERLAPGALLRVQGPLGRFAVADGTRPLLMVAGGTGLAPLQSMVEHLIAAGDARPLTVYWGVRAERDLYRRALVEGWPARHPRLAVTLVLSEPDAGWRGRRGLVHEAVLADLGAALAGHAVHVAGPPAMCAAARSAFLAAGLPGEALRFDAFEPAR